MGYIPTAYLPAIALSRLEDRGGPFEAFKSIAHDHCLLRYSGYSAVFRPVYMS